MSDRPVDPSFGPLIPKRQLHEAIILLKEIEDHSVTVRALHSPRIPADSQHEFGTVETIACKALRAAIEAGAKEEG